jgi:hypothetical protein
MFCVYYSYCEGRGTEVRYVVAQAKQTCEVSLSCPQEGFRSLRKRAETWSSRRQDSERRLPVAIASLVFSLIYLLEVAHESSVTEIQVNTAAFPVS